MARYGLIVYKWSPTTHPSKTSQLATRDHRCDALRKETSITGTSQEIHAMMHLHKVDPISIYMHEVNTCYRDSIGMKS